ncbi:MAG: hypothetical protein KatS3mg077_3341 [Candidatus Binatia bacterium]|nr:MAG: hypothetical protein KatS3mg077_3341 [Candidatus Binatia bacterium]
MAWTRTRGTISPASLVPPVRRGSLPTRPYGTKGTPTFDGPPHQSAVSGSFWDTHFLAVSGGSFWQFLAVSGTPTFVSGPVFGTPTFDGSPRQETAVSGSSSWQFLGHPLLCRTRFWGHPLSTAHRARERETRNSTKRRETGHPRNSETEQRNRTPTLVSGVQPGGGHEGCAQPQGHAGPQELPLRRATPRGSRPDDQRPQKNKRNTKLKGN